MTDLGTDVSDEFNADLSLVSGRALLVQDLLARLVTPTGSLFYDTTYGYDLTQHVGDDISPAGLFRIETLVAQEMLRDERVEAASAKASLAPLENTSAKQLLRVVISVDDGSGPFDLVVEASKTSVELISSTG